MTNALALLHLLLMNIGITYACLSIIYVGFIVDMAIFLTEFKGFEITLLETSIMLNQFVVPVGIMLLVTSQV